MEAVDQEKADKKRVVGLPARLQESVLACLEDGTSIADIAQAVVELADIRAPPNREETDEEKREAAERAHILDIFARSTLLSLVERARQDGEPLTSWQGGKIQRFLDVLSAVSFPPGPKPHVNPAVVLAVLEDLMDMATVPECQQVFSNIETERDNLVKGNSSLALLRTFKKLLKRLSKTKDTVFSGRILMFMATIWSLSERSAVNAPGAFNTGGEIAYNKSAEIPADDSKVDQAFYQTFWSLQEHFRHPALLSVASTMSKLLDALQVVLTYFGENAASGTGRGAAEAEYDTTYLTSPKLLSLQLRDPNFRRHVLLQTLFVLQWLRFDRRHSKLSKPPPDVVADVAERLASLEAQSKQLLRGLPPNGARFAAHVEHVLDREKNWLLWKFHPILAPKPAKAGTPQPTVQTTVQTCPTIEKEPLKDDAMLRPPGKRKALRRVALGNEVLARVWHSTRGDPMAALRGAKRAYVPPFGDYMQRLADELDPEAGIEDEYKVANSPVYEWRGLRLNARHNVAAFGDTARLGGGLAALLPKSMRPAAKGEAGEGASQGVNENDLLQDDEDPGEGGAEESGPKGGGEVGNVQQGKKPEVRQEGKPEVQQGEKSEEEPGGAETKEGPGTEERGAVQEEKAATSTGPETKGETGEGGDVPGEGQAVGPEPMEVDEAAKAGPREGGQEEPLPESTGEGPKQDELLPQEKERDVGVAGKTEAAAEVQTGAGSGQQAEAAGEEKPEGELKTVRGSPSLAEEPAKGDREAAELLEVASEAPATAGASPVEEDKTIQRVETAATPVREKVDADGEKLDLTDEAAGATTAPSPVKRPEGATTATPGVVSPEKGSPKAKEGVPGGSSQQAAQEEAPSEPVAAERGGRGRGRGRGKRKPEETAQELATRRVTRRKK